MKLKLNDLNKMLSQVSSEETNNEVKKDNLLAQQIISDYPEEIAQICASIALIDKVVDTSRSENEKILAMVTFTFTEAYKAILTKKKGGDNNEN